MKILFNEVEVEQEIKRIDNFITKSLRGFKKVVIGISGGIDCDVVARLSHRVVGSENLKLITVIQKDMDLKHLQNARDLASDLNTGLIEIQLQNLPFELMGQMSLADKPEDFQTEGLDAMRAKCNLRTAIYSSYQDHGYIVMGTSNKTEYVTGFYLPFGDGIAHIKPITHLYKSQVKQLAKALGTRENVIKQPGSAGFWQGEEDIEDLAWWLYNEGPIKQEIASTKEDDVKVDKIKAQLSVEKIDIVLESIQQKLEDTQISKETGINLETIKLFHLLLEEADRFKHMPYNVSLL